MDIWIFEFWSFEKHGDHLRHRGRKTVGEAMQLNWLAGFLYHTHPRKLILDIKNQTRLVWKMYLLSKMATLQYLLVKFCWCLPGYFE